MKHIKIVLFSLAVMILFCAKGHATTYFLKTPFGWNPQQITPLSLLPKPASNPAEEIKTAAIYWLPDYMKGNVSRGNTDPIKDPFKENCEDNYDLNTICPTPKISTGILTLPTNWTVRMPVFVQATTNTTPKTATAIMCSPALPVMTTTAKKATEK